MSNQRKIVRRRRNSAKPAHPVLFALQAAGVTAAVLVLLSFVHYKEAETLPAPEYHRTGYNNSISTSLSRLVNELDPAIKLKSQSSTLANTVNKAHLRQLNMPLPRPEEKYVPPTVHERTALPEKKISPLPDMQISSGNRAVTDEFAVLYSADGTELARWESDFRSENATIFRIIGSGIMTGTQLISSCGDKKSDDTAIQHALARGGVPGTYTAFYPALQTRAGRK